MSDGRRVYAEFTDRYDANVVVIPSSLMSYEPCVWVYVKGSEADTKNDGALHLTPGQATVLRDALTNWIEDATMDEDSTAEHEHDFQPIVCAHQVARTELATQASAILSANTVVTGKAPTVRQIIALARFLEASDHPEHRQEERESDEEFEARYGGPAQIEADHEQAWHGDETWSAPIPLGIDAPADPLAPPFPDFPPREDEDEQYSEAEQYGRGTQ